VTINERIEAGRRERQVLTRVSRAARHSLVRHALRYQHLLEGVEVLDAFAGAEHSTVSPLISPAELAVLPFQLGDPLLIPGRRAGPLAAVNFRAGSVQYRNEVQ
jgi:hypothetical protein